MNMSTMRCCSTWNLPIGTPNCLRVLEYSTVASSSTFMQPTASPQCAAMASSMTRSTSGSAFAFGADQISGRHFDILETISEARRPSTVG